MNAFTPEMVKKVNWELSILTSSYVTSVTVMLKRLCDKHKDGQQEPNIDIPEYWAPTVHGAVASLARKIPNIGIREIYEKDGGIVMNVSHDPGDAKEIERVTAECNNRIVKLLQTRLALAEQKGLLND